MIPRAAESPWGGKGRREVLPSTFPEAGKGTQVTGRGHKWERRPEIRKLGRWEQHPMTGASTPQWPLEDSLLQGLVKCGHHEGQGQRQCPFPRGCLAPTKASALPFSVPLSEAAGVAPHLPPLLSRASPGLAGVSMAGPGLGNMGTPCGWVPGHGEQHELWR